MTPTPPHPEQHLTNSAMLQNIVIDLPDGLTVPFALAAGPSGYLAGRTEVEHYATELAREHQKVQTVPDMERREAKELLAEMSRSPTTREMAMRELTADPEQWVKFMMKYELGLEEPDARRRHQKRPHHFWSLCRGWPHSA